jgi:hypothetical protein
MQEDRTSMTFTDRMGILVASVLLTFALTRIIQAPRLTLEVTLPGFYFAYPLTLGTAMTLLASIVTASGMNWLSQDHPSLQDRSGIEHLLLPTLTTFVIGGPLGIVPDGGVWWITFALSGLLLSGVFLAEYIMIDPLAQGYGLARAGLTALAFALFLILSTALRFSGARMFLLIPILFLSAGLISLRILYLDGVNRWDFPWAAGIGLVCAQVGAGLHYWPLIPVQFGLVVTGWLYSLTMLSVNLNTGNMPLRRASVGPLIILGVSIAAAVLIR